MSDVALEILGLTKRFGAAIALDRVSITLPAGGVMALLGPNGAGKSTLIGCTLGFLLPTEGSLRLLGEEVANMPRSLRSRTGYVPQTLTGFDHYKVGELLTYLASFYPGPPQAERYILDWANLDAKARVGTLSGGQKQRLAIVLALQHRPDFLILDEPVASLDPQARHDFIELLAWYCRQSDASVLISSHILSDLEKICTHFAILKHGHCVLQGALGAFQATTRRLSPTGALAADWTRHLPADLQVLAQDTARETVLVTGWNENIATELAHWPLHIDKPDLETAYLDLSR